MKLNSISALLLLVVMAPACVSAAARYTAQKANDHGVEVIRLSDEKRGVSVSIAPSLGNRAYELKVHGQNLLYFPFPDASAFQSGGGRGLSGIPFLAPWANRTSGASFWANGKRYVFNPDLGSLRLDPNGIAIHGMLTSSPLWEVTEVKATAKSAHVTSRLAFWKYPDLMANWPFAHEYEMTYTLEDGTLQVTTTIRNLSTKPMPVSIGFHPYFNLPGVPRAETSVSLPVSTHVETDSHLVATGELTPVTFPAEVSLKDHTFDDGYTGIIRDGSGKATFSTQAGSRKIEVIYGPRYQVAVVYAPPGQNYVCFEPMTAVTNGINLAHDGKYPDLQTVAPGAVWQESFWVRGVGF
jgi:aldose 1-epimerase